MFIIDYSHDAGVDGGELQERGVIIKGIIPILHSNKLCLQNSNRVQYSNIERLS